MRISITPKRTLLSTVTGGLTLLTLLLAGSSKAQAQEDFLNFSIGFKGGVPATDAFKTRSSPNNAFSSADRRWIVGADAEFKIVGPLSFEVDALYKRIGFDYSTLSLTPFGGGSKSTTGNWWEFPGLFKYHLTRGHFQPYIDFGASLRHITSLRETTYSSAFFAPGITDNSQFLQHRNTPGAVFGVGATFAVSRFHLSPEVRYTRWFTQAFGDTGNNLFRTNLDQVDVLVGFNWGK